MRLPRPIFALFVLAISALVIAAKCDQNKDVRTGARVTAASARAFVAELDLEVQSGAIEQSVVDAVRPPANEIAQAADNVVHDKRDFNQLTAADKRALVEDYLGYISARADSIEKALHVKNARRKAELEGAFNDIQRGIALAHVVEAALPPNSQPSPTPAAAH